MSGIFAGTNVRTTRPSRATPVGRVACPPDRNHGEGGRHGVRSGSAPARWVSLSRIFALLLALAVPTIVQSGPAVPDHLLRGDFESCPAPLRPVAGGCWRLAQDSLQQGCRQACAIHQLEASSLTTTYAGSGGTDTACSEVLGVLYGSPGPVTGNAPDFLGTAGLGCGLTSSGGLRVTSATLPQAHAWGFHRACACEPWRQPGFVYLPNQQAIELLQPMQPWVPVTVLTTGPFVITPSLPPGLVLDSATGTIWGTPLELRPPTIHQVGGQSLLGGTVWNSISLQVVAGAPGFLYPGGPRFLEQGVPMTPWVPTMSGPLGAFTATPSLPAGLMLDASLGVIWGIPAAQQSPTAYTISASSSQGPVTTVVHIAVFPPQPCAQPGIPVGGHCWHLGAPAQDCTLVCDGLGGIDPATTAYAGSGGSDGQCGAVLGAMLGVPPPVVSAVPLLNGVAALGCGLDISVGPPPGAAYRLTTPTQAGAAALFFQRVCACNQ